MPRLPRIFALLLLTVWLPVTQHCGLEAAGLIAEQCLGDYGPNPRVSKDGCAMVENGAFESAMAALRALAPDWIAAGDFPRLELVVLAMAGHDAGRPAPAYARPLDWVTTWQFVQRAAPSPRAPSRHFA